MEKINILMVDDRDVIRDGLKVLLSKYPKITFEQEAIDGKQAVEFIKNNPKKIDIVLMDINLPRLNGVEATKQIKAINPRINVIAFSLHTSADYIVEMVKSGASGYVTKQEDASVYIEAFETVYNGGIYLSDEIGIKEYEKASNLLRKKAC